MNKQEFMSKFHLRPTVNPVTPFKFSSEQDIRQSAVLVALIEKGNTLNVVLTKRAAHLKHHAGQISFPGGKVEPSDKTIIDTALREANEEIGLDTSSIEVLGTLNQYQTITGFNITPILALVAEKSSFTIDVNEVDEIFQVPLQHFLQFELHTIINVERNSQHYPVHYMPYKHYKIWGATAAILKDLALQIR